jgi:hypothetical protein
VELYTCEQLSQRLFVTNPTNPKLLRSFDSPFDKFLYYAVFSNLYGQVAQLVERGPEKAGVGGSIPSLATILINNLATSKNRVRISRAYNARTSVASFFTFGVARSQ